MVIFPQPEARGVFRYPYRGTRGERRYVAVDRFENPVVETIVRAGEDPAPKIAALRLLLDKYDPERRPMRHLRLIR